MDYKTQTYDRLSVKEVEELIDKEEEIKKDVLGRTPLFYKKFFPLINKLLDKFPTIVEVKDYSKYSFLHMQRENIEDILTICKNKGIYVDVNTKSNWGCTSLHLQKNLDSVKGLLKYGGNVNLKDSCGNTPLHYAKKDSIVKELLNAGAKVDIKNKYNMTPLHMKKNKECVLLLIINGANVNDKDNDENTPLFYQEDHLSIETLIKFGADLYVKNYYGNCPIHFENIRQVYLKILLRRIIQKKKLRKFVNLMYSENVCKYFWDPNNLGGKWAKKQLSKLF